jgi:hypothetical protein
VESHCYGYEIYTDVLKYKITVTLVEEHEGSTPPMPKHVIGHVSEPVPFTFYPHN